MGVYHGPRRSFRADFRDFWDSGRGWRYE